MKPLVAVVADTREFDNYEWHVSPSQYIDALVDVAGVMPVIIPALSERLDIDAVLSGVDGLLLTGSKTNVHPELYGAEPTEKHEPYDRQRDATVLPVIREAVTRGLPLFAICRGFQEMNVALGGSLITEVHEHEGRMDHRAPESDDNDERFRVWHGVKVAPGSSLADVLREETVKVNSLHRQAVNELAPKASALARAPDGTVEAIGAADAKAFAVGVQWHPEYWATSDPPSKALFEAFGDAVRQHALTKRT
ncbi:MAG: gamma-glutamyl-gamma-aminobutyrate hydrolase family protein [Pseudomonadota bacterium]